MYSRCFELGHVPRLLKRAIIHTRMLNCRPTGPDGLPKDITHVIGIQYLLLRPDSQLVKFIEESGILNEEHYDFRKDRNCVYRLSSAFNLICDSRLKSGCDTFACFIDFSKAYDNVIQEFLQLKLWKYGVKGRIYNALLSLYEDVKCLVSLNGYFTDEFDVFNGVKQGCLISPLLFNVFINDLCVKLNQY